MSRVDAVEYLHLCRARVDHYLRDLIAGLPPGRLSDAMAYSLLNGGKRIRPTLCYAAAELFAPITPLVHRTAAAVELIHAYSLIHDDLPAMDNDDLRRGNPTCHIAFDEATAILAADALQTLAFDVLSIPGENAAIQLDLIRRLSAASGARGMVLGQSLDLEATDSVLSPEQLERVHRHKTGAIISASVAMGAISSLQASREDLETLERFSSAVGLAFQVKDDILDVEGATETLGKQQGADAALNKSTYTAMLGIAGAKAKLDQLHQDAIAALEPYGVRSHLLQSLASYIVERSH